MNTLFNGMKQSEFLNELVSATGLNGEELLDYLLDRIKEAAIHDPSIKNLDGFVSDTNKAAASLVIQKEFNRYNYVMGEIMALFPSKFMCQCPTSLFSIEIECGIKGYLPAHIKIYHPVTDNYRGSSVTTIYGVLCHHYVVEDISNYEN